MLPAAFCLLLVLQATLTYALVKSAFTKQPRRWVAWVLLLHWLPLVGAVDYVGWQAWHENAPAEVARGFSIYDLRVDTTAPLAAPRAYAARPAARA